MKSVIVSGANGFIGNYLVEYLVGMKIHTYALIRTGSMNRMRFMQSEFLHIVNYDSEHIEGLKEGLETKDYDCFVNLAWAGVAGLERADYKLQLENVERTADMLKIASELGCRKFIGLSSVSEFECQLYMPQDEIIVGGRFIYSIAKQTSHYINKCISQRYGIEYINACIANVYGEYGLDSLILHDTIIKLLRKEKTMFTDGTQMYDFLYVKDVVLGLVCLIEKGKASCSYYIGSGTPRPLKYYLEVLRDLICPDKDLGLGLRQPDGMCLPIEVFDTSKLTSHTGYKAAYEYEKTVKGVIDWYKKRLFNLSEQNVCL